MRRNSLLITAVALTALMVNIKAQDISFGSRPSGPAAIRAGAPAAADTVPAPAASPSVSPATQREWLILVFINGVNDLGILGYAEKSLNNMEKVGSSDKVAVVAELGTLGKDDSSGNIKFQRGSKTFFIQKDSDPGVITSTVIYASNDTDMGSPAHLVRFVKRGIRRFPAKKVAVIVWNHGSGRAGISWDDVTSNHMEVEQLGRAMSQIKRALGRKVDVFATDACLMQMAEVAYELADSASVIVGSEDATDAYGYPYEAILTSLTAEPGMPDEAMGRLMVNAYSADHRAKVDANATLSALRTSAMPGFLNLLNYWVKTVTADPKTFKAAAAKTTVDGTCTFDAEDSKDLYDYLSIVSDLLPGSPAVVGAGAGLKRYIADDLIICETSHGTSKKTHGLAIHIPDLRYDSANYEKFAFAADSLWDDFLKLMMEERLKQP